MGLDRTQCPVQGVIIQVNMNCAPFPANTHPKSISLSNAGSSTFPASKWKPPTTEKYSVSAEQPFSMGIPFPWTPICNPTCSFPDGTHKTHSSRDNSSMVLLSQCSWLQIPLVQWVSHFRFCFLYFPSLCCMFQIQPKAQLRSAECVFVHR